MVSNRPDNRGNEPTQQRAASAGRRTHEQTYGGRIGERLKETGRSIAAEQKSRACEELETISEVVHEAADKLHDRDDHVVAEYVDALADQIERAAEYVRKSNVSDLIESASDFARRRPEIVLGGAFVIGLAAARFLKASSRSHAPRSQAAHLGRGDMEHEPFRGASGAGASGGGASGGGASGGRASGGGFEMRTSEAGPIATTPRTSPMPTGMSTPTGPAGAPMHASQQRISPGQSSLKGGIEGDKDKDESSLGSPGPIGRTHYGDTNKPENKR